jgi:hypothetical protein
LQEIAIARSLYSVVGIVIVEIVNNICHLYQVCFLINICCTLLANYMTEKQRRKSNWKKNKIVGKEIHLKKRPTGFVTEDDFELVEVEIPEIKKEGEFLVRNIWMSVDPFMRIFMVKGSKISPPAQLNKVLNGGCVGQVIESKSNKFRVGEYVKANFGWREYWVSQDIESNAKDVIKVDPKVAPVQYFLGIQKTTTTILVTGSTGTVGSEIVKQIASSSSSSSNNNNDIIIRAAIHSQNKADNFKEYNKKVQTIHMDYNKPETIAGALNQVDKLFLLTLPAPDMTVYSNLVKEIRKYGSSVNHIVKLSSMAADETGLATTIGRIHREEEKNN